MLNALIHRAQVTVDNAIGQALTRALVVLPFLVALGFATAAATTRLTRELGPELGYLAVAGGFAVVGLLLAAFHLGRTAPGGEPAPSFATSSEQDQTSRTAEPGHMSDADRELMTAALTTAAPVALPALITVLMRNLPIVAALAALLYILSRPANLQLKHQTSPAE